MELTSHDDHHGRLVGPKSLPHDVDGNLGLHLATDENVHDHRTIIPPRMDARHSITAPKRKRLRYSSENHLRALLRTPPDNWVFLTTCKPA